MYNQNYVPYGMQGPMGQWADDVMQQASSIEVGLATAHRDMLSARHRLAELRTEAVSQDCVVINGAYPSADIAVAINAAEQEAWRTRMVYIARLAVLRNACQAAGFDSYRTDAWTRYYGTDAWTRYDDCIERLAVRMRTSASRMTYLIKSKQAETAFCLGVGAITYMDD